MRAITTLTLLAITLAGCANTQYRDYRDAAWDPDIRRGQSLLDRIPPWICQGQVCEMYRDTRPIGPAAKVKE
jgi:hypothetical protein